MIPSKDLNEISCVAPKRRAHPKKHEAPPPDAISGQPQGFLDPDPLRREIHVLDEWCYGASNLNQIVRHHPNSADSLDTSNIPFGNPPGLTQKDTDPPRFLLPGIDVQQIWPGHLNK